MAYIPELDGIRAIAILLVLTLHAGVPFAGWLGVDVFFVLSGFLITSLLVAEEQRTGRVSLSGFWLRRARRILPPLVVAVGLAWASPVRTEPIAYLSTLAFFSNVMRPDVLGSLNHTWSLAVEEHFYLLWPLVFVAMRGRTAFLLAVILAAVVTRVYFMQAWQGEMAYRFTLSRADSLAIGCLCALHLERFTFRPAASIAAMVGLSVFVALATRDTMQLLGFTAFAVLSGVALAAIVQGRHPWIAAALRFETLRYIGTRSYGLYLYHYPIFHLVAWYSGPLWLKLAATFAVTEVSYQTIERFFRSPGRARAGRPKACESAAAGE